MVPEVELDASADADGDAEAAGAAGGGDPVLRGGTVKFAAEADGPVGPETLDIMVLIAISFLHF